VFVDVRTGRVTPLPESIRSMNDVMHVQASPDGTRLAFETAKGIFVARLDGTGVRYVALGSAPSWSPDGEKIVFAAGFSGFVANLATGSTREIIHGKELVYHPNFSGDGRRILFTRARHGVLDVWSVSAQGGKVRLVLPDAAFGSYSPDGTMIAFRRTSFDGRVITEMTEGSVWLADADGNGRHPLWNSFEWMGQIDATRLWPMWSPDGDSIVLERTFVGELRVIDVGTGHVVRLGSGHHPSWIDGHTLIVENYNGV
jgi:Tol biopolymer transport system component